MKVTKIEKQVKRDRWNVYLDGVYRFSIGKRILEDSRLSVGDELSTQAISKLKDLDQECKAYNRATLILSYRANSENELKKKLLKNFDEKAIEKTVIRLKEHKFVDDAAFAERYVQQSKKGKKLVQLELMKKGVDKETIEKALQAKSEEEELENAKKVAEKIIKKYEKELPQIQNQRLYETLTRKGFSYDVFKEIAPLVIPTDPTK